MSARSHLLEEVKRKKISDIPVAHHASFDQVYEKLQKWMRRFPQAVDNSLMNDIFLFFLLAPKEFLDHRNPSHLFRMILSIHLMQKKLLRSEIFFSNQRDLNIRWMPTNLLFPFASKPVLGCLIGFNLMGRYELFDEENILLALQKHLPQLRPVKKSSYSHASQRRSLKTFYLEIEKKDSTPFSSLETRLLKNNLEEKFKNSIQTLSPSVFMRVNEEEVYKHILVLSQEIQSLKDLPQAYITFDRQTGNEIIFRISLVYVSPMHRFSLKDRFFDCTFISERSLPVRLLDGHPIQAHIFSLHLPRDPSLLRSDGSLDFYSARRKVGSIMTAAIGEFRDYNGGILIKQQELLDSLKADFPEITKEDPELIDSFFYAITPLEKQILLNSGMLSLLFRHFYEMYKERPSKNSPYTLKIDRKQKEVFITVRSAHIGIKEIFPETMQDQAFRLMNLAYNIVTVRENIYFNCALSQTQETDADILIEEIQSALNSWHQKIKDSQVLRIALEYSPVSLDPRIGGENVSGDILHFLFEGLTRFNEEGYVENGVAESIEISPTLKEYTFKLRHCLWNDGSPVTAYDFEYAWKKILEPDFKTFFPGHFFDIKNAREAKAGKCLLDDVGIHVVNDRTLKVELVAPTPYFLQLTAHHIFSPVHRIIDQQCPQWPYQVDKNYPCNGPFQLKINQPHQGYQFVKNPLYWDVDRIKLDQIFLTQMNPAQAVHAFKKKEVNWVGNPFSGWDESYQQCNEGRILSYQESWVVWNIFNTTLPPFNNIKVRQAFSYAIERSEIVSNSIMPLAPAYTVLLPHYQEKKQAMYPERDMKKARQLFHEGLEELGMKAKDLPPLKITYLGKGVREHTAQCLKKQFEKTFRLKCELEPFLSWRSVFQRIYGGNFQLGLLHWTSWVNDPIYTLSIFKLKNHEMNFTKWEHPEFQEILEKSMQVSNPFQRSNFLLKAEEFLSQEMPVIPLFFQPIQALVNKDLRVFYRAPCGPFNVTRTVYQEGTKCQQY